MAIYRGIRGKCWANDTQDRRAAFLFSCNNSNKNRIPRGGVGGGE
jgi:hypothetical protein